MSSARYVFLRLNRTASVHIFGAGSSFLHNRRVFPALAESGGDCILLWFTFNRKSMIAQAEIEAIAALPDALEAAVAGLNDAQLDTPYRAGGWTVRQVVHHVADSHMNAYIRCRLTLTEVHPTLRPYDQDAWAELVDYRLPIEVSLTLIRALHTRWVTLWRSVGEEDWPRTAFHPDHGTLTLQDLASSYAAHGRTHVEQIEGLRAQMGW